ncbi:MAG: hypothetical protein GF347_02400 [Candidatus Moranbacteria bacterium]|nr:hypothetical protein [Candidatus Moranbacteria bacterium]
MLGIYDSGIGGVTVLNEIKKELPDLSFQYLADKDFFPLGEKSIDEIQRRVTLASSFLFQNGCDLIVLACNTAGVNSIRYLQNVWLREKKFKNKQILSITKPFTEEIEKKLAKNKKALGLLLATRATYRSAFYQYELTHCGFGNIVFAKAENLAGAIEENDFKKSERILREIFKNDLNFKQPNFILLACTHYPLIQNQIKQIFNQRALIIDPAKPTARKLKLYLERHQEYKLPKNQKPDIFWISKNSDEIKANIGKFYQSDNYKIKKVDLPFG